MAADTVVEISNVWKIFGARAEEALRAVRDRELSKAQVLSEFNAVVGVADVSLSVNRGEIFCIMGLSGSGKSTLVRHFNRLLEPTDGKIEIEGIDVMALGTRELQRFRNQKIGMVFQNFALMPHRSVLDNVAMPLEIRQVPKNERMRQAAAILDIVELGAWGAKFAHELSGGMQQRVGLARALAANPDVLLMDEPFSALDPLIRRQLQDEFIRLSKILKKTTIFITHDLDEAVRIGDRIAIMRDGKMVQMGTAEDIVMNPADDYVADFVAGISRLKVVHAHAVMQPIEMHLSTHGPIPADATRVTEEETLSTLITMAIDDENPIIVQSDGTDRGIITRADLLRTVIEGTGSIMTDVNADLGVNPLEDTSSEAALAYAEERRENIRTFVRTSPEYYIRMFDKIGASASFTATFNAMAGLFGPIWFGARGLWNWALPFLILEALAFVQIARGLFGDLSADAMARIASIEGTLALRKQQLASAIETGSDKIDVYQRTVDSLEANIGGIRAEAEALSAEGPTIALTGLAILIVVKLAQSLMANWALEARFSEWLSDRSVRSGMPVSQIAFSAIFMALIVATAMTHYSFPGRFMLLSEFPTDPDIRLGSIDGVETFFNWAVLNGEALFDAITYFIRMVLDALELVFVSTPWIVVAALIVLLTWLTAGVRMAIYSSAFLAYMGLLGFWEKAMTTLALLGTAACLSILIGIPLGMFAARRPRFYSFIQPIMDFMQTMPAFVFMIPVIAFFGTGKPAAVVTTMIFGGTPVVRLTVLGLRGVPESVREAAISFGANKWYLLTKVDLPLASPSIRAGINQTIMLSLAMVVVASLIGAKGLGEDVLEALQYANVGQGILAGFSILFCAMILDRIVQGGRK